MLPGVVFLSWFVASFVIVQSGEETDVDNIVNKLNEIEKDSDIVLTVGQMLDMVKTGTEENFDGLVSSEQLDPNHSKQTSVKGDSVLFQDVVPGLNSGEEKKCIEKVVLEEQTEYDQEVQCHHRYRKHCYTTYTTIFDPVQVVSCVENYKKDCYIEFGLDAVNHTVKICRKPLEKDCSVRVGEERCSTHFESECWTRQLRSKITDKVPDCQPVTEQVCTNYTVGYVTGEDCKKVVRMSCSIKDKVSYKFKPLTECKLSPVELCGPPGCGVREGKEICHDRRTLVVYDKPEETCDLEPVRNCRPITKLVPRLKAREECIDVPLEICVRLNTNPQKVSNPVLKIWCYRPKIN